MSVARIQKAFEAEVAQLGYTVAWDNSTFNPADSTGEVYLVPSILPTDAGFSALQQGFRIHTGIYQILLVAVPGSGSQRHYQAADNVAKHFAGIGMPDGKKGVRGLPADDDVYVSGNPSVGVAYDGQNGYTIPVSIPYQLDN